jgi:hypothetical protein
MSDEFVEVMVGKLVEALRPGPFGGVAGRCARAITGHPAAAPRQELPSRLVQHPGRPALVPPPQRDAQVLGNRTVPAGIGQRRARHEAAHPARICSLSGRQPRQRR